MKEKKKRTTTTPKNVPREERRILWFDEISITDIPLVGGKNASLGEMYSKLTKKGVTVPNGFAVTSKAYWEFLAHKDLKKKLKTTLKDLDVNDIKNLKKTGKAVRALLLGAPMPKEISTEVSRAYKELAKKTGHKKLSVAVRSSATAEDLPDASFAGQQETYLNVCGEQDVLDAVKKCIASLFTDRAMSYREGHGFDHLSIALSVTVQEMVRSDTGASGVMFTMDTESGFQGVSLVTSAYGLGEYVVQGKVVPDQFYVFKDGLQRGKKAVISRTLGSKQVKLIYGKTKGVKQARVSQKERNKFAITDNEVIQLATWGAQIEAHYKKPQDIEWAKDGETGKLYIVQARPETVKARSSHAVIENYELKQEGKVLLTGTAVGQKIGAGKVRVIEKREEMKSFKKGEILVTRITDPDWEPIMRIASAIVTEQGGKTSHAAIVSRELGVPCIVGAKGARKLLKNGSEVTVSCAKGDEGVVYKGILPFEVKRTELDNIPDTKTGIMMNVGDPDHAFALSFLPNDGIGLARQEFIFSNFIRIHPQALLQYNTLKDKVAKKKIREMTLGYKDKSEYCVSRLAEGIGRLGASMYPKPVILRLSDFKTNEYRTLIGGKEFEPEEQNPMIGWRGASRYYSDEYKEAFGLECKAIKRAREEWGLDNIIVMVPFCRTPEEGEKVLKTMESFGLKRGENDLQVYVMCEIPSNVILAEEFAKIFDGFSIGSNDLTQLTLGVDRDSSLVSHVYDENNPAVKKLIKDVIAVAHKYKKKVGICGQAPSDYPEFAEFLVRAGIDSISLNPDTVVDTRRRIAAVEKTVGNTGKKTHKTFVSLVASLGIIGAGLISLGAGCGGIVPQSPSVSVPEVSPAEIRMRAEEKATQQKEDEVAGEMTEVMIDDFVDLHMSYPIRWHLKQWRGGVTVEDPTTGSYMTVAEQLVSPPEDSTAKPISVDGVSGTVRTVMINGKEIMVADLFYNGQALQVSGTSDMFENLFKKLDFVSSTSPGITDDRPLNEWDVKEGRLCAQVITYAKQSVEGQCQAYPTPCAVPDGWQVCEGNQ
ncbi:MAG: phosphoenolpyruvate synthase [Candidatus Magasanikbacteria bacterium CG_4_10_14_0_8_um_filter_42_12]|nr:MAG: phosphoenolpyruvate synthase [Candidatus Magasanikbacteria bacterium CG_4_10_14_0_8_um_filter_42_12]